MTIATMTSKGQITIPAATRAKLRLAPGSRIDFVETDAGEIVMRPVVGDVRRLRGFVKYEGPPVSVDEMTRAIGEAAAASFRLSGAS